MRHAFIAGFAAVALAGCATTGAPVSPAAVADLEAQFRNECAMLNMALDIGSLFSKGSQKYATAQAIVVHVCGGSLPGDLAYAVTLVRNARKA